MRRLFQQFTSLVFILVIVHAIGCGDSETSGSGGGSDAQNNGTNNGTTNNGTTNNGQTNNGGTNNGGTNNGGNNGIDVLTGGPNDVVEHEMIHDRSTLDVEIDIEGSGRILGGGVEAHLIAFTFTSHDYGGNTWRHQASLYLPLEAGDSGFMAIVDREEDFEVNPTVSWTNTYGIGTAVANGMPVLILNDIPGIVDLNTPAISPHTTGIEGRCLAGPLQRMDVMAKCMIQVVHNSGDITLDPFYNMAISYMRAITAVQALPSIMDDINFPEGEDPPGFDVTKAALFGAEHRAAGVQIAAGADTRVQAIFVTTGAFGALDEYFALQEEVWVEGHTLGDPVAWRLFLNTPEGAAYKAALDPVEWPAELLAGKRVLRGWGTQMTFAPIRAFNLYRDSLPEETYDFVVRDAGDGIQTRTHAAVWQNLFLAFAKGERPMTRITSFFENDRGNIAVTSQIQSEATVDTLLLMYVLRHRDDDDLDFRDAVWEVASLEPKNDDFIGSFAPVSRNSAYLIYAVDQLVIDNEVSQSVVASPVMVTQ